MAHLLGKRHAFYLLYASSWRIVGGEGKMEKVLNMPLDYESWPEFRMLRADFSAATATWMMLRLFVSLGYRAQAGEKLGVMDEPAMTLLDEEFSVADKSTARALRAVNFLDDAGYCTRFVKLNPQLDAGWQPFHAKGNAVSKLVRTTAQAARTAGQMSFMIPPEVWMAKGEQLAADEISRVMILVRGCDSVLNQPERAANERGWSQTMVENAFGILKEFSGEQLDFTLRKLIEHRAHPSARLTTEQLLGPGADGVTSRFAEFARGFAGEG
jgi:hypothetical protein